MNLLYYISKDDKYSTRYKKLYKKKKLSDIIYQKMINDIRLNKEKLPSPNHFLRIFQSMYSFILLRFSWKTVPIYIREIDKIYISFLTHWCGEPGEYMARKIIDFVGLQDWKQIIQDKKSGSNGDRRRIIIKIQ